MGAGDLELARYEVSIVFKTEAILPLWSGNILRSGFGARLREMICVRLQLQDDCSGCPLMESCAYDFFYNSRLPEGAEFLRKQKDIPRPFTFEPPVPGRYEQGSEAFLGFTLFGKGISYLPYFLLAIRNLGESGIGPGFREGKGKFDVAKVDCLGYGARSTIFQGDTVYNRSLILRYEDMLKASEEHYGSLTLSFSTPTQIKEGGRFTAVPTFRGFMGRLLSRANALAAFYGAGMLYDYDEVLDLLGRCRNISVSRAKTEELWEKRRFYNQGWEKKSLAPFFNGEITYSGEFSKDMMALLELGRLIHVGKMATFGNGCYELDA